MLNNFITNVLGLFITIGVLLVGILMAAAPWVIVALVIKWLFF